MSKRNGQQISEIAIVGGVIFSVCALSVFLFGDQISNVFSSNKSISMFGGSRSNIAASNNNSVNATSISINGQNFNAPVDKVLLSKLSSNSIQTSGSSGNIEETVKVLEEYISQLNALLLTMPASTQKNNVESAIQAYENAINKYKSMNQNVANEANRQLVKDMDITTDLEVSGTNAVLFNNSMTALLASLDPASTNYKMLEMYKNSMLNLGKSMEYSIDSRNANLTNIVATYQTQLNTKMSELSTYFDIEELNEYFTAEEIAKIKGINSFDEIDKLLSVKNKLNEIKNSEGETEKSDNIESIINQNVGILVKAKDSVVGNIDEIKITSLSDNGTFSLNNQNISKYTNTSKIPSLIQTVFGNATLANLGINLNNYTVYTKNSTTPHEPPPAQLPTNTGNFFTNLANTVINAAANAANAIANGVIDALNRATSFISTATQGEDSTKQPIFLVNKNTSSDVLTKNESFEIIKLSFDASGNPLKQVYTNVASNTQTRNETAQKAIDKINEILELKKNLADAITNYAKTSTSDLTKVITVYRDGTYQEILPESYNGDAICKTLGKVSDKGACNL